MPLKKMPNWPPSDESFDRLSKVKKKILELLWPGKWVNTHDLHEATGQSYYDRRLRELREAGWQIETEADGLHYRLKSHEKLPGNRREYPSAKQKREVFARDKGTCQICGSTDLGMQFDHKIPRERLGLTETSNLQLFCSPCNVDQRGACKKCVLPSCDGCPYAYPESFKERFVLLADGETARWIEAESERQGITESDYILNVLMQKRGK